MRANRLTLSNDTSSIVVDPRGGKLTSCKFAGLEILREDQGSPMLFGSYVMAPFPGRIRNGRFSWLGTDHQMPQNMPPHAIHGTVFERQWEILDDTSLGIDLGPSWPFPGRVVQRFDLQADRLVQTVELHADVTMPAAFGWHPWFRRQLGRGDPVHLWLDVSFMFERGSDGIPTGRTVSVPPGPWDDCFGGVGRAPVLRWNRALELEVTSDCDYLVVYDEPRDAVCVEPQTAPPNAHNDAPPVVEPGRPLVRSMTWKWRAV